MLGVNIIRRVLLLPNPIASNIIKPNSYLFTRVQAIDNATASSKRAYSTKYDEMLKNANPEQKSSSGMNYLFWASLLVTGKFLYDSTISYFNYKLDADPEKVTQLWIQYGDQIIRFANTEDAKKVIGQPARLLAHQIEVDTYDRSFQFFKNLAIIDYAPQTIMRVAVETPTNKGYIVLDARPEYGKWKPVSIFAEKSNKQSSA